VYELYGSITIEACVARYSRHFHSLMLLR